jgi:hypothetical protein
MLEPPIKRRKTVSLRRALIEIGFIVFLFYANLLMGEFTASNERGKSFGFAIQDIFTGKNLGIAILAGVIGYFVFEHLRRNT